MELDLSAPFPTTTTPSAMTAKADEVPGALRARAASAAQTLRKAFGRPSPKRRATLANEGRHRPQIVHLVPSENFAHARTVPSTPLSSPVQQQPNSPALGINGDMDDSRLNPAGRTIADQRDRDRRIKDAQELAQKINGNAERSGTNPPPYEFLELIGKGAFGKVYKCLDKQTNNLVAVKIIDIDEQDWKEGFSPGDARDTTIKDFKQEVSILRQLKDNNAKNINLIHDAFDWHSQLWIVADYCTGGSVRTLMRPFEEKGKPIGLPEQYVVPIARELAIAMKSMHDLNIMHRDIKCANVYITEDGDIQLGDFGIVGVIDHDNEKRKTVVGTPHWMPREIVEQLEVSPEIEEGYGYEVDVWSFGCTVYEMATGSPPYATKAPYLLPELLEESPPRLEGGEYSAELRDFVAFCLNPDKTARPTSSAILNHPYIKDTSRIYPTRTLVRLIERFKIWEHGGGSRLSLWQQSPADSRNFRIGDDEDDNKEEEEELDWNFSTSETFDQALGRRLSQMPAGSSLDDWNFSSPAGSGLPPLQPLQTKGLTVAERIKQEHSEKSASRGEKFLNKVFDPNDPTGYQLATPVEPPKPPQVQAPSDLPLRAYESSSTSRESVVVMLDLDEAVTPATDDSSLAMRMAAINEDTIRPIVRNAHGDDDDDYQYAQPSGSDRRDTRAWTFDSAEPRVQRDTRDWTFETAIPLHAPLPAAATVPQPNRATIAWSFETAGLAAPELLDDSYDMASGRNDENPATMLRPTLTHTATEPPRHLRGLSSSSAINRESVTSLIDLDAGLAERVRAGNEILRPGTASSHMTDATSGNPFDLEDDPEQKEVDRDRFSYHKPYASEGGMVKRLSHKTMPMHARGASLSSTEPDLELPRPAPGGYSAPSSALPQPDLSFSTLEQGLGLATVESDNNQWPSFSDHDSFTSSPQYLPVSSEETRVPRLGQGFSSEHRMHTSGTSISSRSREPSTEPPGPEVDFPNMQAPHPDVLGETADDRFLEDELGRMLSDCDYALSSMSRVLHQHASIEAEDDEISSEFDSAFDSSYESRHQDTEDEDTDHLTARRKPRKLEMRSSPRVAAAE